jgi:Ca2+-binding EF-hand superfamily protein
VFDREGHGFITVPDLIQVLTSLGDKLTQGNRDEMGFLNHLLDKFN